MKPKKKPVYVGTLYSVNTPAGVIETAPQAIGVDPKLGLVTASSRSALTRRQYLERPRTGAAQLCDRLWYNRKRKGYAGSNWYHELENARVILDHTTKPPRAWFSAPSVRICKQSGQFLCG